MKWYEFKAQGEDHAELWIYSEIGENFWGEGVAASTFVPELNAIRANQIDLHINSYGGNVFDGMAMYTALQRHPARVTCYVDGVAASIASIVALAGDEVVMPSNAMLMIHNPMGSVYWGSEQVMRQMADSLAAIKAAMLNVYEEHSTKSRDELAAALDAETWLTADDAVAFGFVQEPAAALDIAACYRQPPAAVSFRHLPDVLVHPPKASTAPVAAEATDAIDARRARALSLLTRL